MGVNIHLPLLQLLLQISKTTQQLFCTSQSILHEVVQLSLHAYTFWLLNLPKELSFTIYKLLYQYIINQKNNIKNADRYLVLILLNNTKTSS